MRNLIYFVVGCNPLYIELTSFCLHTIKYLHTQEELSNIDFMCMCDAKYAKYVKKHMPQKMDIHLTEWNDSAESTSKRKLEIFNYKHIDKYNKILYLDSDIICIKEFASLFEIEIQPDILYVKKEYDTFENLETNLYFGLNLYTVEDLTRIKTPFNASHFLFMNNPENKQTFSEIVLYMKTYEGDSYYEQSFLNHFYQLSGKFDTTVLDMYFQFYNQMFLNMDISLVHLFNSNISGDLKLFHMKSRFHQILGVKIECWNVDSRNLFASFIKFDEPCTILEIGVLKGDYSDILLTEFHPKILYLVDPFEGDIFSGDAEGNNPESFKGVQLHTGLQK